MQLEKKLFVGIPKGHLNSKASNEGWTQFLLRQAGWKLEGYDPGEEKPFPEILSGDKEIKFVVMRPRSMPLALFSNALDMVLCGNDIFEEYFLSEHLNLGMLVKEYFDSPEAPCFPHFVKQFAKELNNYYRNINSRENLAKTAIMDLGYGKINLSFMISSDNPSGKLEELIAKNYINCVTEYPYIARREFLKFVPIEDILISSKLPFTTGGRIKIANLNGSELMLNLGAANIILECISSGSHLREYGLKTIGQPIMSSSVNLHINCVNKRLESYREDDDRSEDAYKYIAPAYLSKLLRGIPKRKSTVFFNDDNCERIRSEDFINYDQHMKNERIEGAKWVDDKIQEVAEKLKKASIKYGKTRPDSIHFK